MYLKVLLFIFILQITLSGIIFGQKTEHAIYKVTYQFTYVYDSQKNTPPIETEVVLRIGQTNSSYRNAVLEELIMGNNKVNAKAPMSISNPKAVTVIGRPMVSVISKLLNSGIIYQVPSENKLVKIESLGFQEYEIEMPLPNIEWKIENEKKLIGSHNCIKALGNYGGRNYTAWFAPDLPFQYGPWKFSGLPGLILEIKDEKNEVVFKFKEMIKSGENDYIIYSPYRPVLLSEKEFKKAKIKFDKNIIAASEAQLGGDTKVALIIFIDSSGKTWSGKEAKEKIKAEHEIHITNPIELKE